MQRKSSAPSHPPSSHQALRALCQHLTTTTTFHSACNQTTISVRRRVAEFWESFFFFSFKQKSDCSTPWLGVFGSWQPSSREMTISRERCPVRAWWQKALTDIFAQDNCKREQTCWQPSVWEVPCLKVRRSPCFGSCALSYILSIVCGFLITASGLGDSESPHRSQHAT